jgi:hypothetical protein
MSAGYGLSSGVVAQAAATAKTTALVIGHASELTRMTAFDVSFDGTNGAAVPVTVELVRSTLAGAGVPASGPTPVQLRGLARACRATAGIGYTTEPTALTVLKAWYIHAQAGKDYQFSLGREIEVGGGLGLGVRITAAAAVNSRTNIEFEEG